MTDQGAEEQEQRHQLLSAKQVERQGVQDLRAGSSGSGGSSSCCALGSRDLHLGAGRDCGITLCYDACAHADVMHDTKAGLAKYQARSHCREKGEQQRQQRWRGGPIMQPAAKQPNGL